MPVNATASHSSSPSPADLRSVLGANLRQLSKQAASISALCRDLGINRTQYNRYLSGESFPRPDVLHRICTYFSVDARILLEPVEEVTASGDSLLLHPAVVDFMGATAGVVPEKELPSGFYRFSRRSFSDETRYVQGLIFVYRDKDHTFLKGFEARDAMARQGLPTTPATREFRGPVLAQEEGVAALVSRRGATTTTFNYLARVPSFENNFWVGYVARTVRENVAGRRVERLVYEYLGHAMADVLPVARAAGFCAASELLPYHRTLLKVGEPFA